ncbi:hypothetical protein C2E25_05815 [Geothermobacter hydrogeniphilus]|uniref:DUF3311 domain-containing protein n=1 Tax=Geothermobacter hydrogeniphilus TaxID=1969733 RepID=A0A2K2HBP4_9BACT|nr:hypothetical protein [Geothermobacter hydrogeniphilus]PNU20734.1 hypothetical protein C2E25_05815 [Geothermobacter hydrogeniphilus]
MKKMRQPSQLKEAWVLCFLLGVVMLNYPFIHIFNKDATLFGIPILILYLMVGWPLSIMVIFLFTRLLDRNSSQPDNRDQP